MTEIDKVIAILKSMNSKITCISDLVDAVLECNCSFAITELNPPVDEPTGTDPVVLFNPDTETFYYWDGDSWEILSFGGGSDFYFSVSRSEAEDLITAETLVPGALYKINDRGDRGIFLEAISTTQFSEEGTRIMLVPTTYELGGINDGNDWQSIWRVGGEPYSAGQLVIWNAHVYQVIGGNNDGTDPAANAAEYTLITKSAFVNSEYTEKIFSVIYDWQNDWISEQWDNNGNRIKAGVYYNYYSLNSNPAPNENTDFTDWNYVGHIDPTSSSNLLSNNIVSGYITNNIHPDGSLINIYDNSALYGIYNNSNTGDISNNTNTGGIYINSNGGEIINNANTGDISNNTNAGRISNNSNGGEIINNANTGEIYSNFNGGEVANNSNTGDISNNSNTASIATNSIFGSIAYNNNLGDIQFNTLAISIQSNNCGGSISFNDATGDINFNSNSGGIAFNTNTDITFNSNNGAIESNTTGSIITYNSNNGNISTNTNSGIISFNSNEGTIEGNSNDGSIYSNTNNGYITSCTGSGGFSVYSNNNNGNIDNPAGLAAADVTDVIVNK